MSEPIHLALWSGPRNISTAMLRAWGSRPDTYVCDEPLYAHYLLEHGHDHPGRKEIIAHHESDLDRVVAWLTGDVPDGRRIFYQKQMTHHLVDSVDRQWIARLRNGFLIREPEEMLTSLVKVLPGMTLRDTGMPQQAELFERECDRLGSPPPVVDSVDVLNDPEGMLRALCNSFGVEFDTRMLRWDPGPRATDGVWAKHWYGAVEKSTGFGQYRPKGEQVPQRLSAILTKCERLYERLATHRLTPSPHAAKNGESATEDTP